MLLFILEFFFLLVLEFVFKLVTINEFLHFSSIVILCIDFFLRVGFPLKQIELFVIFFVLFVNQYIFVFKNLGDDDFEFFKIDYKLDLLVLIDFIVILDHPLFGYL